MRPAIPAPWIEARFLIATSTAQRFEAVEGWAYRGIGLHVCPDTDDVTVITHINSGFALRFFVAPIDHVVALATAVAECSDAWSAMMVPSEWREHDLDLESKAEAIFAASSLPIVWSDSEGTDEIARELHEARVAMRHLS